MCVYVCLNTCLVYRHPSNRKRHGCQQEETRIGEPSYVYSFYTSKALIAFAKFIVLRTYQL